MVMEKSIRQVSTGNEEDLGGTDEQFILIVIYLF